MKQSITELFVQLKHELEDHSIPDVLQKLAGTFPGALTFSTSFSYEDQVIIDFISKSGLDISVFTLDTGRLFSETYSTWSRTIEQYENVKIKAYYPNASHLEPFVEKNGPNAFY